MGWAETSWKDNVKPSPLSRLIRTAALREVPPHSKKSARTLTFDISSTPAKASQIFFSVYENKLGPTIRFAVTSYAVFILFFLLVTWLVYRFRNQGYMERRYYYEQDLDTLLGMYEKEQEQVRNWIRKNG